MKFSNTTGLPDHFVRRMLAWCCRQVGLQVRRVKWAKFSKTRFSAWRGKAPAFSGWGGSTGVDVRIGPDDAFPTPSFVRHGVTHVDFQDRMEALVGVTAHECYHRWQWLNGCLKKASHNEPAAMNAETTALEAFRKDRERLLAAWSEVPARMAADAPPKPTTIEKRSAKAARDLARWQRKLKLAQGKVKHYTRKVAYYQRKETPCTTT